MPFETAGASPGFRLFGGEFSLPRVLSAAEAARYARIFDLQNDGRFAEAAREMEKLGDPILVGHVLYQRYLHPRYRTTYEELRDWLALYGDHPGAERLHRLALKRKPQGARPPPDPRAPDLSGYSLDEPSGEDRVYVSPRRTRPEEGRPVIQAQAGILEEIRAEHPEVAERKLQRLEVKALLEPAEFDDLLQRVALAYYHAGDDRKAFELAARAAERSGAEVPQAHWVAGLAAWRLKRYSAAEAHFAALARSPVVSTWDLTAGAYWASRAALRSRKPSQSNAYLVEAARYPRTFYGLLAARQLGHHVNFRWDSTSLQRRQLIDLTRIPGVRRGLALAEIGQNEMAGHEIRRLYLKAGDDLAGQLIAVAGLVDAPAAALKLAVHSRDSRGWHHDSALYPLPPWQPESGFTVDRALLFAFMRQESKFETNARSGAGATGLMQIMPRTAALMARDKSLVSTNRDKLLVPGFNLELGQRYLQHLLLQENIRGNLIVLAAGYNAGPGNAARWQRTIRYENDPLLFIESIPIRETRIFVGRVLTNFWIYRSRFGQDEPSLDALAGGRWPYYVAMDDAAFALADHEQD
ncbi:MAG: lytic transglycosylase domain-containing protein [Alphaproteobacteria bacterium]|nr:lytic transglycosylase domain-containing protein [Alphaproteobacteria bacterium]